MITRIRDVRRARGLTLQEVGDRCVPPTTAQTIGRLETGTRTVSVGWLNRIAAALGVTAGDLVELPARADLPVAAVLGHGGVHAPKHAAVLAPPLPAAGAIALLVESGIGDYRAGDALWLDPLAPDRFAAALNRDVLAPRAAGRFLFGRLIGRDAPAPAGSGGKLHVLPPGPGQRQQVLSDPPWLGVAVRLVRELG